MKTHKIQTVAYSDRFSMDELGQSLPVTHSNIDPYSNVSRVLPDGGTVFYFNFGAIGFIDTSSSERKKELESFRKTPMESNPYQEDFLICECSNEKPRVEFNRLIIDKLTPERSEVVVATVAQSVTMECYEKWVDSISSGVDEMVARLVTKGTISPFPGKLHQKIGQAVAMRSSVVRVLHLLDRPDLIWDDPVMDDLYNDLRANFDLDERFQALEYKLNMIQDTFELLLDTARDRRLYWLEAIIVILIAVEIFITLFDRWALT